MRDQEAQEGLKCETQGRAERTPGAKGRSMGKRACIDTPPPCPASPLHLEGREGNWFSLVFFLFSRSDFIFHLPLPTAPQFQPRSHGTNRNYGCWCLLRNANENLWQFPTFIALLCLIYWLLERILSGKSRFEWWLKCQLPEKRAAQLSKPRSRGDVIHWALMGGTAGFQLRWMYIFNYNKLQ